MNAILRIRTIACLATLIIAPGLVHGQTERDRVPPVPGATVDPVDVDEPGDNSQLPRAPWFSHVGVREQLRLSNEQYEKLNRGYQTARNHFNQAINKLDRDLTPDELQQREKLAYIKFLRDFTPTVRAVFPTAEGYRRYQQLYVQYRGYAAFLDPAVQERLNLTDVQREKLNDYDRDWNQRLTTWREKYPKAPDAVASEYNESRQEIQTRTHALLSLEQRQAWHDLRGEPYDFSHEVYIPNSASSKPVSVVK